MFFLKWELWQLVSLGGLVLVVILLIVILVLCVSQKPLVLFSDGNVFCSGAHPICKLEVPEAQMRAILQWNPVNRVINGPKFLALLRGWPY